MTEPRATSGAGGAVPPPGRPPVGFDALLAALPASAQDEFRGRARAAEQLNTVAELFADVRSWLTNAAVAEGRGGYPGGRGAPDWTDYVEEQRRGIAVFRALVDAFGEPSVEVMTTLRAYEQAFPAPVRLLGDGWEPHVDDVAGRLIYSLPVASGVATASFAFTIALVDLEVLRADQRRRSVLEVVAHTVLQRSMLRGGREVTQHDFRGVVDRVLHGRLNELEVYLARISREYNVSIEDRAHAAMERRAGVGS